MNFLKKFKNLSFKAFKKIRLPLVILLVIFTVVFSLFRALTPWVGKYKTEVEQQISQKLEQPVTIQSLETSWYWFRPVLKLNKVKVVDNNQHTLEFDKLLVGVNLWSSLVHWQLQPGVLYLGDVDLVVRQTKEHWEVDGLNYNQRAMSINSSSYLPIVGWLLSQDSVVIRQLSAKVFFADGQKIILEDLNFKAVNGGGRYKMYGNAKLSHPNPTAVSIVADLQLDPNTPRKVSGSAYFSLTKFLPAQWLRFIPKMPYQLNKGLCDLEFWLQIKDGEVKTLQSKIDLKDLLLVENDIHKSHKIDSLAANIAWRKSKLGWYFTADKVDLDFHGTKWPRNKFALTYNTELNSYNAYVENILIDSLRSADVKWPHDLEKILDMQPTGTLRNTQLHVIDNKPNYILSRFINLGWEGQAEVPEVKQISGVLYWQPSEGRLVLDGEKTKVKPKDLPEQTFDVFNADIYWKQLNNGLRVDLDRFVLSNANLTLSANGVLDNYKDPSSNIRIKAEFSAREAQQFLAYIPSGHLKPKFEEWLKKDVKKIKTLSGRMLVSGSVDGFPYDTRPGKFIVTSHVSGVDLAINQAWPLNRDIDADLEFNKRSFTANVGHAKLENLQINKLNLAVNNIGYGTESLLIHGEVEAPGKDIKSYIYATPLKNRLVRWRNIDINEEFWLDIQLDIPLYPENDHVASLGEMVFSENPVTLKFAKNNIKVKEVSGNLKFNEYGLTGGSLTGLLDGSPLSMHARAMIEPQERTVLAINGEASMDLLRKITNSSVFSLFNGSCNVSGVWTIYPSVVNRDTIHLDTNLEGVSVALPPPLAKSAQETATLTADLVFLENQQIQSKIKYNDTFNTTLLFTDKKDGLNFTKGELKIGKDPADLPNHQGLKVIGEVENLDVEQWRAAFNKMPKDDSKINFYDFLYTVNVKLKHLTLSGNDYKDLKLLARKSSANNWFINLQQDNFIANLKYAPKTNLLSGVVNKLTFDVPSDANGQKKTWQMRPKDIPNIDLLVEQLQIKDIDAGSMRFKSTSTEKEWKLDSLEIKSPFYKVDAEGGWKKVNGKDQSTLEFQLQVGDLAKSLERLHIAPVVHSHNGNLKFEGGFNGPFYAFDVKNLVGYMQVVIKHGRISNFDREVEEKIGLGKILSILSLQTIPRRLKLDFSDLAEDGYSFDVFKGTFAFTDGIMSTTDSYIDGPVAYAKMTGNLDLSKQLYDVNLRITPYITASLPVVATIAGGPVAGLATWVASNLINKGMQTISGYTYRVSGPWSDPVVQQVKIYQKHSQLKKKK